MENYPKKSKTDKVVDTIHVGAKLLSLDIGQWGTSIGLLVYRLRRGTG